MRATRAETDDTDDSRRRMDFVDWDKVDVESVELPADEIKRAGLDQPVKVELEEAKEDTGFRERDRRG